MYRLMLILFLAGCTGKSIDLGDEWAPLKRITEAPATKHILGGDTSSHTLWDTVYVPDLGKWLLAYHDEVVRAAMLTHERVHAMHQQEMGLDLYLDNYLTNREFMWQEEQAGWRAQIRYLIEHGKRVDPKMVALVLKKYWNLKGAMVSEDEALEWATKVVSNPMERNK